MILWDPSFRLFIKYHRVTFRSRDVVILEKERDYNTITIYVCIKIFKSFCIIIIVLAKEILIIFGVKILINFQLLIMIPSSNIIFDFINKYFHSLIQFVFIFNIHITPCLTTGIFYTPIWAKRFFYLNNFTTKNLLKFIFFVTRGLKYP